MKTAHRLLRLLLCFTLLYACHGCATTTVRTVTTDKSGTVTETVTVTKAADPAAVRLAGLALTAYAPPRAAIVREEKSATPSDLRRILHGRPITRQEIANRWQPAK